MSSEVKVPDWLTDAIVLHRSDRVDGALDLVFSYIHDSLWERSESPLTTHNTAEDFPDEREPDAEAAAKLNELMKQPFLLELPLDLLFGILVISRQAKHRLPARAALCDSAAAAFTAQGENGEELVKHLR